MSQAQLPSEPGREPLLAVAEMLAELGERLSSAKPVDMLNVLTDIAVDRVPGADAASVTTLRRGKFSTVSATEERARGQMRCNTTSAPDPVSCRPGPGALPP